MAKFCVYCGDSLDEGTKFCPNCGKPVSQPVQPANPNTNNQRTYDPQPPRTTIPSANPTPQPVAPKKKGGGKTVLVVALLAIVAILAVKFFRSGDKEDETDGTEVTEMTTIPSSKPGMSVGKLKTKDENFFGVTLPFPKVGRITENTTRVNDFGHEATTIRMDKISYEQYKEYCKILEALPGWEKDDTENVARMPSNYNDRTKVYCSGSYGVLPDISVQYYNDEHCKRTGLPHFCMFVFNKED